MLTRRRASRLALVAAILLSGPAYAEYLATLEVETQLLDLETGIVVELDPSRSENFAADLQVAYNADRLNPLVVFQNQASGTSVIFLDETIFDYVDLHTIANEEFTNDLVDRPFDPNDTIVVFTSEGNLFKLGNAVDNGDGTISFDVGQLN